MRMLLLVLALIGSINSHLAMQALFREQKDLVLKIQHLHLREIESHHLDP